MTRALHVLWLSIPRLATLARATPARATPARATPARATRALALALATLALAPPARAAAHAVELSRALIPAGDTLTLTRGVLVDGQRWPARVIRVEIPPGETVRSATLRPIEERSMPLPADTYLAAETPDTLSTAEIGAPEPGGGYALWVLPEGDARGHRIAHVLVVPFREEGTSLRFLSRFELDLVTAAAPRGALTRRIPHPRTERADRDALELLLDAEPLGPTSSAQARAFALPPELEPITVEHVIVTTASMASAFQEIADLRSAEGMPSKVTTMEWILANYDGIDPPARVRAYLRDAYLYQGLRYAMLAGDTELVPTRIAINRFQSMNGARVIADLYFGALDGDWNADGDGRVGEAPDTFTGTAGDDVDLYADIVVGRVPASSPAEAAGYVAKWKSYTGHDPATFRNDYQNRILSLGEVLFPSNWKPDGSAGTIILDGADLCESTLTYVPPVFEKHRMYQNWQAPEHAGSVPEERLAVIAEIDEGYGIVDHVGHGFRTVMSVGDGSLGNTDADGLTNTNAYSVLYAVNCTSGAISFDCIGEHLIMNPSGGCIASVSSTDLDYPTVSDELKYAFFDALFNQDVTRIGDTFDAAHWTMLPSGTLGENAFRWTLMTHILMGDPALEIWRDRPDSLDLAFAATVPLGTGSFSVTVTDDGSPVEGARVALSKNDGYGVGTTNASGVATVDFLPDTGGTFQIVATSPGYVPAKAQATVTGPVTAALRVGALVFHDGTAGGGTGNANSRIDAGESIVVDLTIRNDGSVAATGARATLLAGTPHLTVIDDVTPAIVVGPGGSTAVPAAFRFDVDALLPDSLRHVVADASIRFDADQGSWTEPHAFSVHQRILDVVGLSFAIDGDDGDGVLESGETAEISLTLSNVGEASALAVVGVGSCNSGSFVFVDDTAAFGTIEAGQSVAGAPFRLLSTGGGSADLTFHVTVSDAHAVSLLVRSIDALAPARPDTITFSPDAASIRADWPRPADPDVRGYRVHRAPAEGGPFVDAAGTIVDGGSYFVDEGLAPLTSYWYRVATVDSSGNQSAFSEAYGASTAPPQLEGWPVDLPSGESKGSPTFADVDRNGSYEVILGWNQPMVLSANGGDFVDGDDDAQTVGIFADLENGESRFWNSPAVVDLDRDGVVELVFAAWQTTGTGHLYVLDATGAIEPGWPQELGKTPWSTPAVGDADGDGEYEIFVASGSNSGTYRGVLFGFHHDGTEIVDGDDDPSTTGVFFKSAGDQARFLYGSPALADLTGDGRVEIVYFEKTDHAQSKGALYVFRGDGSVFTGFPYTTPTLRGSTSSPAVGDLDGDRDLEIVAVTESEILVLHHDGTPVSGWPKSLPMVSSGSGAIRDFLSSPAIGDVNLDGQPDIALGWLNGDVHLWTGATGQAHAGFPVRIHPEGSEFDRYLRSPILGNLDGDPNPEIIVSSGDAKLFAVKSNGSALQGFPLSFSGIVHGSAAIWDVDGDGEVNLIVQTNAPSATVFDFSGVAFDAAEHPWPMFRHNQLKTGLYRTPNSALDTGGPSPSPSIAAVMAPRPNPFGPRRVEIPFDVPGEGARVLVRVFDVQGREVRRLADGRFPTGSFRISWDGRSAHGIPLANGTYFVRAEIGPERFARKITLLH